MTEVGLSLEGKTVWVTGAGRGAGRAIADGMAALGANVLLQARTATEIDLAAEKIRANGGRALAVAGSVADPRTADRVVNLAVAEFGRLDVLINNAGISPALRRSEQVTDDEWSAVIDTNLSGPFYTTRAAGRVMLAQGSGSIVNVSSVHGTVGFPRLAAYSASKGGLELLTKTFAVEWAASGVRVNAVAPGYLETQMTEGLRNSDRHHEMIRSKIPLGRFGRPEEVVAAVAYLASDASSYVTGTIVRVDGGWTAQ
ncbi:SDR family NAD(P)-dependent oxidoreductase [Nocardioides marmotae]|uniref:SDR family NAD(P)-dependent oxidoreductase n=1 Tax=Nocardioides marmotae TaxID=2663857 RepID=UPI0012B61546|nr:3-oxoacyl-ACP reductase family protein [Nocardioides marmotae]MBC9732349.1 3-oxoacyl-ACP reductase FabG [Nocardioides marmotae]MTB83470.1 glucose 1-dehydrogenase [Nocardioides marmotae]